MAQLKKNCYFVTELKQKASDGEYVSNVYHYDDIEADGNTPALSAEDQAKEKYYEVLGTYWNDDTYDYIAVNIIRVMDNVCIMGSYKDTRIDPEPEPEEP